MGMGLSARNWNRSGNWKRKTENLLNRKNFKLSMDCSFLADPSPLSKQMYYLNDPSCSRLATFHDLLIFVKTYFCSDMSCAAYTSSSPLRTFIEIGRPPFGPFLGLASSPYESSTVSQSVRDKSSHTSHH